MNYRFSTAKKRSISLIEVLIDATILGMLAIVVISTLLGSFRSVTVASTIATAGQLANEKMEVLRNKSYDSLSTQHGPIFPQGAVLDDETVIKDGKQLTVHTDIDYVDDPYDGLTPADTNPADYKKITLTVYDAASGKKLTYLSTNIASRAAETASNTGVLKISVINASGNPVDAATATITRLNSNVVFTTSTDVIGSIFIPNLPPSSVYHIVVTKSGYSTDSTNTITVQNPHPINPDPTVLLQQVTSTTLSIDQTSSIHLLSSGLSGSISIIVTGQKLIGTNPDTPKTRISKAITADTTLSNLDYDSYVFTAQPNWYITTCDPFLPLAVPPNTTVTVNCTFSANASDLRITRIAPTQSAALNNVALEIKGTNFGTTPTVSIQAGQGAEIGLGGLSVDGTGTSITGLVDFSAVQPWTYSVIVRNGSGGQVIQQHGLIIQ